jgi:hypothetical protein
MFLQEPMHTKSLKKQHINKSIPIQKKTPPFPPKKKKRTHTMQKALGLPTHDSNAPVSRSGNPENLSENKKTPGEITDTTKTGNAGNTGNVGNTGNTGNVGNTGNAGNDERFANMSGPELKENWERWWEDLTDKVMGNSGMCLFGCVHTCIHT